MLQWRRHCQGGVSGDHLLEALVVGHFSRVGLARQILYLAIVTSRPFFDSSSEALHRVEKKIIGVASLHNYICAALETRGTLSERLC